MERYLLPYPWKIAGWILAAAGTVFLPIYFLVELRLTMPVLVLFSAFMEVKYFTIFRTNIVDELMMLALLAGFFMVVFSKDRQAGPPNWELIGKALFKALYFNSLILLISILFIFGQGFMAILFLNMYSVFILYLVFYYGMKAKN